MEAALGPLLPLYERERAAGRALVLGVLLETTGSTYRKPGALILIAADGEYAGLLSGGCLEGDLAEHAREVLASGHPQRISYDLRDPGDLLWGLGLGCEGAMHILLLRVGPAEGWQPLACLAAAHAADRPAAIGLVTRSSRTDVPLGLLVLPPEADPAASPPGEGLAPQALRRALELAGQPGRPLLHEAAGGVQLLVLPLALPPRILLLGAGPDALPVVDFGARLGWKITVADHRDAYARPHRFPQAHAVRQCTPDALGQALDLDAFHAAVVMSHQLPADLAWLRVLAASRVPYVGLLGPAMRREKLLDELGPAAERLQHRLHAPVGLPLGGRSPEAIALGIVAEIHACLHQVDPRSASAAAPAGTATVADA